MKIRFVGGTRDGDEADVLDSAGRRLVAKGVAEEVSGKAKASSEDKPAAKKAAKAPASKAKKA
jgi:hypothetical protein